MNYIIYSYLLIIGASLGSFSLVLADRLKSKRDWIKGRSVCDSCGKILGVLDMIPVISYVFTRGRCRYCKVKLTPAYPLVEILSALTLLFSYMYFPYELNLLIGKTLFFVWVISLIILIALFVYDARWYRLPNKLVYPLIVLAFVFRLLSISIDGFTINEVLNTLYALIVSAGIFLILYVISSGKWIGDGDIRLGVAMGLFLPGPVEAWIAIFLASILGLLLGLPSLVKSNKKLMTLKLPFGPALVLGLILSLLFSKYLIDWYTNTFLFIN
ncbi:prepilin peptidase [Candidatus Saccharibacteria bacterium]|nr:prepilin peptidase [Candidatus Saccharibacteria bacterium]